MNFKLNDKVYSKIAGNGTVTSTSANNIAPLKVAFSDHTFCYTLEGRSEDGTIRLTLIKTAPDPIQTQWSFHSASDKDIDIGLILESLTHKHPLVLTKKENSCWICVHTELYKKARACKILPPREHEYFFIPIEENEISQWIDWAKQVKAASWPKEHQNKGLVKVTLLSI